MVGGVEERGASWELVVDVVVVGSLKSSGGRELSTRREEGTFAVVFSVKEAGEFRAGVDLLSLLQVRARTQVGELML